MKKIEFFRHSLDQGDIARVNAVLGSIFLTTGAEVAEFEDLFAAYVGSEHVVGVTSCTAALHLSLLALGIGPGDEVITTPMSFCATSNAILHAGATPVFVDVEKATGNIDADRIERAVTGRTKAIIPVHLYGQMCDMKRIRDIADRHHLKIIEDAAHAIEAEREGISPGKLADTACFSFYATKNITSGEGGAVSTNDRGMAERLKMLRLHGLDRGAADRYTGKFRHYDVPVLGWKYNMDNIQGALLIGQVRRIEELWRQRERVWKRYVEGLGRIDAVTVMNPVPRGRHAHHLFTILVSPERRDGLLLGLQERGIGVAVNYRPVHLLALYRTMFGFREGMYPVAEEIGARTISLPLYPTLTDEEVDYVIDAVCSEIQK